MIETHPGLLIEPLRKSTHRNEDSLAIVSLENLVYFPDRFIFTGKTIRE